MKKERKVQAEHQLQPDPQMLRALEEEQARQRSSEAERERELRKACSEDYRALAEAVEALFDAVADNDFASSQPVESILKQLEKMYETYDEPLLLENMQLVRYDDSYYQYHAINVAFLAEMIGKLAGASPPDMERLFEIGIVMDFGMLLLSENIVSRTGRLNPGERIRVRQHMLGTVRTLKAAGVTDDTVIEAVLNHHERYNGGGYPRGISGEDIPLLARIVAIADSFDAALARKEYGKQKTLFQVMMEIEQNSNGALDPKLTKLTVQGIAKMLVGRFVVLSDRSVGKIVKMDAGNYVYPEVVVVGKRVQTGPELYPVSLSSYLPLVYGASEKG